MAQIDTAQALTQFVGSLPTFIAVILAWMNSNSRTSDLNNRIGDLRAEMNARFGEVNARFADTNARITDTRDLLRSEFKRVEEVMDARVKHLEERE